MPAGMIASVTGAVPTALMHCCTVPSPPQTNRRSTPASTSSATSFGTLSPVGASRQSGSWIPRAGERRPQGAEAVAEGLLRVRDDADSGHGVTSG